MNATISPAETVAKCPGYFDYAVVARRSAVTATPGPAYGSTSGGRVVTGIDIV